MKLSIIFQMVFISLVYVSIGFAQWSNNPSQNLTVCDLTGEQALSKIVSTSDGGCYISWFDTRSGNYHVYLQRLDVLGNKQWATDGLLISNNPQNTFIVDYDLNIDQDDNTLLVFSDTRNGENLNPYAYKISPNGDFLWGANGVELNPTADFQPNPKIVETSDSNIVVAWIVSSSPTQVALQKISPNGIKLWGSSPVFISSATEGINYPSVVKSDNGSVIVIHTLTTGSFPAQTVKIRATKIESNGIIGWGGNGVMIQNIGTIAAFTVPEVISDGDNGGIVSWHDDRDNNNLQSAFIQRISSTGSLYFPVNGSEGSLEVNTHKFNPVPVFNSSTGEAYIFWLHTNSTQSQNGLYGQKFSPIGDRLWGNNGITFKTLGSPNTASISSINAQMGSGRVYVFYLEGNGSGLNQKVEGFACDAVAGNFLWPGNFVTISNPTTEKLQMVSAVDLYFNCKLSWGDKRLDAQGIYAQDCNPNGELGNSVVPVELVSFSASYLNEAVELKWKTETEINNKGFEIERSHTSTSLSMTNWEKIGFVEGNGTTVYDSSYSFNDKLPANIKSQKIYYRLKQIDYDGSFTHSDVIELSPFFPGEFKLEQNYPNPFNPTTKISWQSAVSSWQTLKVYDVLGNEVSVLVDEERSPGVYEVEFDASHLASGIYYYQIQAGDFSQVKKMILSK